MVMPAKSEYLNVSQENYDKLVHAFQEISQLNRELNTNLSYNMRFRDYIIPFVIGRTVDPSIKFFSRNGGPDYINSRTTGECKAAEIGRLKRGGFNCSRRFEFEKHDEKRNRIEALKQNSFLFVLFDDENVTNIILAIYINTDESVKAFRVILRKRMAEFLWQCRTWKREGQRMKRDTTSITLKDVLSVTGAQYITGDFKEISKQDALNILGLPSDIKN